MSTPQKINVAVLASATTLYTAWVGTIPLPSRAQLVDLDLTNTTTADITIDVWYENAAGSTLRYLADDLTVPAKGTAAWRGLQTIDTISDKWRAQASATGIDCTGTVVENA